MDLLSFAFLGFLLYIVVFLGVKHGINYSELGILIKKKYKIEEEMPNLSNDDIEKELEKDIN
ncbi:hypothetical protein JOC25_000517 [Solibacillus kalamii]|uniref:Uncharacterized protein n=1 Tax=Solibacillus kalamii TaxID=1748298 RepID=A0ABX3ZKA0_9BACL|nr:hypothetical protein [Solibacillus kalamii]MBM7664061.1 hypothetical protein [Solibacillus kalamii]OUZ40162.1 hypothetical protein CBM15_06510 [Solibacillus kalamii]